jgi:hypothetical protein
MPREDGKRYYSTDFTEKDICRWKKHRIYAIMDGDDGQGDPPSDILFRAPERIVAYKGKRSVIWMY